MNLKEAIEQQEQLQNDIFDITTSLKKCGNWAPECALSWDDFMIGLQNSNSISIKVLVSTKSTLEEKLQWWSSHRHISLETGEKVKFNDCVERIAKLEEDCNDLKDAIATIGNYSPSLKCGYEEFLAEMRESKRCSVELLISSLVLLEEELRIWLSSEIINSEKEIN